MGHQKKQIVKIYYEQIYSSINNHYKVRSNSIFDFRIDVERGIEQWAPNKATGIDNMPGIVFKDNTYKKEIKSRLEKHFTDYLHKSNIPKYFMEARLILISKEDTEYPSIEKTRPISILPTITKIFELSIIHHLEVATKSPIFWKNQRGFLKEKSTINNICDLLSLGKNIKTSKIINKKESPAIVFFDLKKAYDLVPRNILAKKLQKFNIPCNIIKFIGYMLNKFTLIYEGKKIKTQRGLVQGSALSPLLFNLFINDLMVAFMINDIDARAYADDIVCIWKTTEQVHQSISIVNTWSISYEMIINAEK